MIDSINFIIREIKWINFNHLNKLRIYPKKYYKYQKNGLVIKGYSFTYKCLAFKFDTYHRSLIIIANAHRILNKRDILLKDKLEYELKLYELLRPIFEGIIFYEEDPILELNRIDYCIDFIINQLIHYKDREELKEFFLTENDMNIYHIIQWFNKHKYKYMKRTRFFPKTLYFETKYGMHKFYIYERYSKTKREKDKGIYRMEVQCKSKHIKKENEKYDTPKIIDYYWSEEAMEEFFFVFLKDFFYEGDYYKLDKAEQLINKSKNKVKTKHALIKFIKDIGNYTLNNLFSKEFCKEANKNHGANLDYTNGKINYYIKEKLDIIGVNPIPIQDYQGGTTDRDSLPNLLKLARGIAEERYFK